MKYTDVYGPWTVSELFAIGDSIYNLLFWCKFMVIIKEYEGNTFRVGIPAAGNIV